MPVVNVHRFSFGVDSSQRKIVGTLVFPGLAQFNLDSTVTWAAGQYVLISYTTFDYANSGPSGYPNGQACLDALVGVANVILPASSTLTVVALTDDSANSRITVTLA